MLRVNREVRKEGQPPTPFPPPWIRHWPSVTHSTTLTQRWSFISSSQETRHWHDCFPTGWYKQWWQSLQNETNWNECVNISMLSRHATHSNPSNGIINESFKTSTKTLSLSARIENVQTLRVSEKLVKLAFISWHRHWDQTAKSIERPDKWAGWLQPNDQHPHFPVQQITQSTTLRMRL